MARCWSHLQLAMFDAISGYTSSISFFLGWDDPAKLVGELNTSVFIFRVFAVTSVKQILGKSEGVLASLLLLLNPHVGCQFHN